MRVFPSCEVQWVYNADGSTVPHASTLRHARAFNRHLVRFLARLATSRAAPARRTLNLILPALVGTARLLRPA